MCAHHSAREAPRAEPVPLPVMGRGARVADASADRAAAVVLRESRGRVVCAQVRRVLVRRVRCSCNAVSLERFVQNMGQHALVRLRRSLDNLTEGGHGTIISGAGTSGRVDGWVDGSGSREAL
jgi:hypothetical protein